MDFEMPGAGKAVGLQSPVPPSHGNGTRPPESVSSSSDDKLFAVDQIFWKRVLRLFQLGVGSPLTNPLVYILIIFNAAAQIGGGYVAQSHFYYTGTGTSSKDPGMAGCLKRIGDSTKTPCTDRQYTDYLNKFSWTFFVLILCVCAYSVTGDVLNVLMRRRVGARVQAKLFTANVLYDLSVDGRLDNFDQRLTNDLQMLLDGLCCVFFGNTNDYIAYPWLYILTRLICAFNNTFNPPNRPEGRLEQSKRTQIGFAVLAMFIVTLLAYLGPMNIISKRVYRIQELEGNFHTTHAKTIKNAESIAMYGGSTRERQHADSQYRKLHAKMFDYYLVQSVLMFLRVIVTIAQPAIGIMLLSLTGATDVSYAGAFLKQIGNVLEFMLDLPTLIARLAFASGTAHRVGQLLDAVDVFEIEGRKRRNEAGKIIESNHIKLTDVSASPPTPTFDIDVTKPFVKLPGVEELCYKFQGKCQRVKLSDDPEFRSDLFTNLNLTVRRGEHTVIMGPSGCGKSSMLRVIAGLWSVTKGSVERPLATGRDGLFFLPQRSYLFEGSLIEQVMYPLTPIVSPGPRRDEERARIFGILRLVELDHVVESFGLDAVLDWSTLLPAGERQQLSFARLFFHSPAFCLADESTCSLSLELETLLLKECITRGITLVSVAHRSSVVQHHEQLFVFDAVTKVWSAKPLARDKEDSSQKKPLVKIPAIKIAPQIPVIDTKVASFDYTFLLRCVRLLKLVLPGVWPMAMLVTMICCAGLIAALNIVVFRDYKTDKIIADIMTGETTAPFNAAGVIVGIQCASAVFQSLSAFAGVMLAISIQRAFVVKVHSIYYGRNVMYAINNTNRLEGVDQRIVFDLGGMREALSWLFGNPFSFLNFRLGLLPLSTTFVIMLGYAFHVNFALSVFFLGSLIAALLFQALASKITAKSTAQRAVSEGKLRSHLAKVKMNIESITFFNGQTEELAKLNSLLGQVSRSRLIYIQTAAIVVFPTVFMYYWLSNGDYVMATIIQTKSPFKVDGKTIITVVQFCGLMGKVGNQITMSWGGMGMLSGYVHRVAALLEKCEDLFAAAAPNDNVVCDEKSVGFSGASIFVNDGSENSRVLVDNLTLAVKEGERTLVMGPSACGKSSITRALAGLWPLDGGHAIRPAIRGAGGIFFIPQQNYVTEGSLKQQIIYPFEESTVPDVVLQKILEEVCLGYISQRWGFHTSVEWENILSGGEAQRLGLARMLFHRPKFVVCDEGTSALDPAIEVKCMEAITSRKIGILSVASRHSQLSYHDTLVFLTGKGGYSVSTIRNGVVEGVTINSGDCETLKRRSSSKGNGGNGSSSTVKKTHHADADDFV